MMTPQQIRVAEAEARIEKLLDVGIASLRKGDWDGAALAIDAATDEVNKLTKEIRNEPPTTGA
jgi:hypothetical protein